MNKIKEFCIGFGAVIFIFMLLFLAALLQGCKSYEELHRNVMIPDSTYSKMRSVFPDLPSKQVLPDDYNYSR